MKKITLLILLSFLVLFVPPLQTVQADDPSPWGEFLNPDGSIQWDKLVDLGVSSQEAGWMDVTLPGGVVIQQQATFHRYQTPSGNVLVLPEPVTLFFMALHPAESGLTGAESMLGNGASILTLLVGGALTPDQLAQLVSKGYTDPMQFFQAVIDGREDIWSIVNFNFLGELFKMTKDSGFLVNALLLYLNGAANCADIPGGCSGLDEHCLHRPYLRAAALALPGGEHRSGHARAGHPEDCPRPSPGRRAGSGQTRGGYPDFGGHPAGGVHLVRAGPGSSYLPCERQRKWQRLSRPGQPLPRGIRPERRQHFLERRHGKQSRLAGRAGTHPLRAPRGAPARDDHRGEGHRPAQPGRARPGS